MDATKKWTGAANYVRVFTYPEITRVLQDSL
jgi:hypothetical protein